MTETLTASPGEVHERDLLPSGSTIGPYTIDHVAASGGFGVVYRASTKTGERVAVKVLARSNATVLSALGRFRREVELIQRSRHPNIVEILTFGELATGCPYIVMEWIEGITLSGLIIERGPLDLATVLTIMEGLASALATVHAVGVVHRDLKGSNIMLLESEDRIQVKLLDFGIAKMLDNNLQLTRTGSPIGTPGYMAPEQLLGQLVGPPTDIFTLGILLFQMLTGEHPREPGRDAETVAGTAITSPSGIYPRLLETPELSGVPYVMREIVARCLAPKPYQRYASVEELLEDLKRIESQLGDGDPAGAECPTNGAKGAGAPGELSAMPLRTETKMSAAIFIRLGEGTTDEGQGFLRARRLVCEAEGFTIGYLQERSFLALVTLPDAGEAARAVRTRALRLAFRVVRADRGERPSCSATVHTAPAVVLLVESTPQFTGGDVLDVDSWARKAQTGTVIATAAALRGIDNCFVTAPAAEAESAAAGPSYFSVELPDAEEIQPL